MMCTEGDAPGPYKWLILLACFGIQLTGSGITYCVGVFYVIFEENIGGSSTSLSLASSLNMGFFYCIGPIAGLMTEKFGCRPVALIGAFLGTIGLGITVFSTHPWHLHLSFGLVTGIGCGLTYIPSIAAIPQYFNKNRPLAIGLVVSGLGTGPIVFPPLIQYFLHEFGWRGALLMTAGLYTHTIIFALLLRPNNLMDASVKSNGSVKVIEPEKKQLTGLLAFTESLSETLVLTNYKFALFMVHHVIYSFGNSIIFVHMGAYAISRGVSEDQAAMLFLMLGIASATMRPITGLVAQTKCLSACRLYYISLSLCSASTILFAFGRSYLMFCAAATLIGVFYASYGSLTALVAIDLVGVEKLASAYGYVCVFCSLGFVSGGTFAGWLYDTTNYYPATLFTAGGLMLLSMQVLIPLDCKGKSHQVDTEAPVEVKEKMIL